MKGLQCYELFGGIALNNHAFSFHFHISKIPFCLPFMRLSKLMTCITPPLHRNSFRNLRNMVTTEQKTDYICKNIYREIVIETVKHK